MNSKNPKIKFKHKKVKINKHRTRPINKIAKELSKQSRRETVRFVNDVKYNILGEYEE